MDNIELQLPEMLQIPEKLLPILTKINDYRYFLIEGGRGGGKSQAVGRVILYLAEKKNLRIVCGREIQNSIAESVYSLLADLILKYNLCFEVLANKITHKQTNTAINFRGFREQGAFNIQGMEGIDVVWIDESQAITKETLDVLIPTIRKDRAKIFFTMNRYVQDDPVFSTFVNRKDCLHIHINYTDNPYCSKALINEAEECKLKSEVDYNHIWLGEPLSKGDDCLFSSDLVYPASEIKVHGDSGLRRRILGVDVARFGDDETVFTIIETRGVYHWQQIYQDTQKGKDTMWTTGVICDLQSRYSIDLTVVDEGGVGGGVIDRLNELNRPIIPFDGAKKPVNERYTNARSEGYFDLKDLMERKHLKLINDSVLMEQLLSVRFKFKSNGQKAIVSKDEMRKEGLKSPDRADALMMAVSQLNNCLSRKYDKEETRPRYGITDEDQLLSAGASRLPQFAEGGI